MNKKYPIEQIKAMIKEIHGDTIRINESTYKGMSRKCKFIDKDYGEWITSPSKIIHRKQGHKARAVEKARKTFINNYGVDNPLKDPTIKNKIKNTCMKKYGVNNPAKNKVIQEKMSMSMIKAYEDGSIIVKREKTCMKRYGVKNVTQCPVIRAKMKDTLFNNYGVIVPAKNKVILNKMKVTNITKYGVDNPSKNKVIIDKIINTNIAKYGVKSTMQYPEIATKNARAQSKSKILKHWKTNEELICIGSYERAVVKYLNKNKINFKWQSKTFNMPDGRTYRPDIYLYSTKKWIEIKGYFRNDALEKWEWFRSVKPNSELWNKKKLMEMKIL